MDIGLKMSISTNSIDVAEIAAKAEALGFESIWLPEHPVMPVNPASKYPGSPDGSIPASMSDMGDPYIGLARASAVTNTIKLGTGITLIPERNPLVLAGAIASLDRFSGGRFLLGIGTGWLREETEIMGGDFDHRWTQARESIEVMRALWTQDTAEYHGRYYDFPPVQCNPKPAQEGGPPVRQRTQCVPTGGAMGRRLDADRRKPGPDRRRPSRYRRVGRSLRPGSGEHRYYRFRTTRGPRHDRPIRKRGRQSGYCPPRRHHQHPGFDRNGTDRRSGVVNRRLSWPDVSFHT